MTDRQKSLRHEARRYGAYATSALRHALNNHREADEWRQLATRAGVEMPANVTFFQTNADKAEAQAVRYARRAWHVAGESVQAGIAELQP